MYANEFNFWAIQAALSRACAQKKARGDRQKNCQLSKLYKMNVTKIENLCAATGQGRRGKGGRGQTDRQSHVRVVAESIRTDVPVRELFSFFAFLWHM